MGRNTRVASGSSVSRGGRRRRVAALTAGLAVLTLHGLASAQVAWVVDDDAGPGVQFSDIPAAVAAAASGDTILVKDGNYSGFVVSGKSLAIVADATVAPKIGGTITITQIAFGQRALLRGIESKGVGGDALVVTACDGTVRVEACRLEGSVGSNPNNVHGFAGARVELSQNVSFVRCDLVGGDGADIGDWLEGQGIGGSGLWISQARVACYDVVSTGGEGGSDSGGIAASGTKGGDGGYAEVAQVFASGSTFAGGSGGHGGSDWTWGGCGSGGAGGAGMKLSAATLHEVETTLIGGPGGFGVTYYGCSNGAPGPALVNQGGVDLVYPNLARGLTAPALVRALMPANLTFDGQVGDSAFLLFSVAAGGHQLLPSAAGVLLTHVNPIVWPMGSVGANGELSVPITTKDLPPGIDAVWVHVQSAYVDPAGSPTLGSSSELVLLRKGL